MTVLVQWLQKMLKTTWDDPKMSSEVLGATIPVPTGEGALCFLPLVGKITPHPQPLAPPPVL